MRETINRRPNCTQRESTTGSDSLRRKENCRVLGARRSGTYGTTYRVRACIGIFILPRGWNSICGWVPVRLMLNWLVQTNQSLQLSISLDKPNPPCVNCFTLYATVSSSPSFLPSSIFFRVTITVPSFQELCFYLFFIYVTPTTPLFGWMSLDNLSVAGNPSFPIETQHSQLDSRILDDTLPSGTQRASELSFHLDMIIGVEVKMFNY